ncbi:MAG: HEAT repeat domain-containing protein [bacterium]|nr:HEAT repeat domain-containing protein [bacterium]
MSGAPQPFETTWQECIELLDRLPSMPVEERLDAIERLIRNPSPGVRSRSLRMGAAAIPDERLKEYLRADADDVLRNAGLEMLKMRGNRGFSLTLLLLKDDDPDVVLQAVIVLTHLRDPRALEPLRSVLHHPDPNVVQEAIVAIGQIGDARAIPDLLGFLEADSWLQMAAVQALGNLRSPVAVPHLKGLLTDFMAGPLAAEALARIGGLNAFKALAQHWLRFRNEVDNETTLGLLAHLLEGLANAPQAPDGLVVALDELLDNDQENIRVAVARCLLALETGTHDAEALNQVASSHREAAILPACIHHRSDLIPHLLAQSGLQRAWGFLLVARFPKATPASAVVAALQHSPTPDQLGPILRALSKVRAPEVGSALLGFYLRLPEEQRTSVHPLIKVHRRALLDRLAADDDIDPPTRVVLSALLGGSSGDVETSLLELGAQDRVRALHELLELEGVMRGLPWLRWLEEAPETYGAVAAEFASRAGLRDLAPNFREMLKQETRPFLIRTLGELGDRESVPLLIELLEPETPFEPLVLESLGRVGGPEARSALRAATSSGRPQRERMAYRALARCATEEDDEIFRDATDHSDWYVRLSCAEVLGRFSRPENLAALAQLAADPVPIVAQRALSFLEA